MTDKNTVRALLDLIAAYLEAEAVARGPEATPNPHDPVTLLMEAEEALEDLAIHAGFWGPPRTVAARRDPAPGSGREAPGAAPQGRRQEVYDATVQNIAFAMSLPDTSPGCAPLATPDPTPVSDAGGGSCE